MTQSQNSVAAQIPEKWVKIFGARPWEFVMPPHLDRIFRTMAPFPTNLELPVHGPSVCKKSGTLPEAWMNEQLVLKKLLGAFFFIAHHYEEDFVKAHVKLKTPGAEDYVQPDASYRGMMVAYSSMALIMDRLSRLEKKKNEAQAQHTLGKLKPVLETDESKQKKNVREVWDVAEVVKNTIDEGKLKAKANQLAKANSGQFTKPKGGPKRNSRGKGNYGGGRVTNSRGNYVDSYKPSDNRGDRNRDDDKDRERPSTDRSAQRGGKKR
ncbi:MAG: hypothetical protein ACK5OQ_15260 [Burkholderiales bacterium]